MCSKCQSHKKWWRCSLVFHHRTACKITVAVTLSLSVSILVSWAVLRPKTPDFVLEDATVYSFNASTYGNLVTSQMQVTITSHNSNRQGISYDRLDAYASFRDEEVTMRTSIPPTYEGSGGSDMWSPYLSGISVPVSPSNALALSSDKGNGVLRLEIKVQGRVTWKLGSFSSGGSILVNCPIDIITYGNSYNYDVGGVSKSASVDSDGGVNWDKVGGHSSSIHHYHPRHVILVILFIILVIVLVVFANLHPWKPSFVLQDATMYAFNVAAYPPNLLTSMFQVTILAHNPNDNIAIYYDSLDTYATYQGQQITLPPAYADYNSNQVWSPFIYGYQVPIAPYNAVLPSQAEAMGSVTVNIMIDGGLRRRVGAIATGSYHI
ncbi:hypothetical protein MLD38_023143 [Melastoma candidum]|uniref:Uncharacterized protein n=1 Tax=Melastoma candidum TaxID=119954 RepID=A0ACB9QM54_9MYRT|nr:hypothetical protein MLD38_023143 [Melastoma candidum]